mmetsp:Transcript_17503/g.54662  ORF Transcript_17503/g.54662 Transcript_17503/m.54662 type:complete len:186 (+) Transcript_17503:58-615(+)
MGLRGEVQKQLSRRFPGAGSPQVMLLLLLVVALWSPAMGSHRVYLKMSPAKDPGLASPRARQFATTSTLGTEHAEEDDEDEEDEVVPQGDFSNTFALIAGYATVWAACVPYFLGHLFPKTLNFFLPQHKDEGRKAEISRRLVYVSLGFCLTTLCLFEVFSEQRNATQTFLVLLLWMSVSLSYLPF